MYRKVKVAHTKPIPVLGSQPAGDVSHKPGGRLLGEQKHDGCEQFA